MKRGIAKKRGTIVATPLLPKRFFALVFVLCRNRWQGLAFVSELKAHGYT
jgi:hypothetical protein